MEKHEYFSVEPTSATIMKRGALAIYCGDAPRKNDDGSVSHSLRAPLLMLPPGTFRDSDEIMRIVAAILNENASRLFPSAASQQTEHDRQVLAGEA